MIPSDLITNIPAPGQPWQAPVEDWVRALYAERQRRAERRRHRRERAAPAPAAGEQAEVGEPATGLPPA